MQTQGILIVINSQKGGNMSFVNFCRKLISTFVMVALTILFCFWAYQLPAAPSTPASEKSSTASPANGADQKCQDWSRSYDGVCYRYCYSDPNNLTTPDLLQWYNKNKYKVRVTWEWTSAGTGDGSSKIEIGPDVKTDLIAISWVYKITSIKVEK
jgi:hypothetical protein